MAGSTPPPVSGNAPAPLNSADPRKLGKYVITGRLGQGGMGTVFLGHSPDGDAVAIKVIKPELAERPEFRARFRREAENARRVRRFTTAAVLDADPDGPWPYLVTEYVEGPTLSKMVNRRGPLRPADLEQLALSVATALSAIHAAGIVHRDLTPANVLLSPVGPKVIDFGLARDFAGSGEFSRTARHAIGTPGYMAPEQIMDSPVTSAADVFAWGAITIFAATGRQPFGEGRIEALLFRILYEPANIEGVPDELAPLVDAALRKSPADRPTAEELRVALMSGAALPAARLAPPATGPGAVSTMTPDGRTPDSRDGSRRRRGHLFGRGRGQHEGDLPSTGGPVSAATTDLIRPPATTRSRAGVSSAPPAASAPPVAPATRVAPATPDSETPAVQPTGRTTPPSTGVPARPATSGGPRPPTLRPRPATSTPLRSPVPGPAPRVSDPRVSDPPAAASPIPDARPATAPRPDPAAAPTASSAGAVHSAAPAAAAHPAVGSATAHPAPDGATAALARPSGPERPADGARPARDRRGRRTILIAAAVLLVVAAAVAVPLALTSGSGGGATTLSPTRLAELSTSVAKAADSSRATDPARAARLSLAAYRIAPSQAAEGAMVASFAASTRVALPGSPVAYTGAAVTADGRLAAATDGAGHVRLWDLATAKPTLLADLPTGSAPVPADAVFLPGGDLLTGGDVGHAWTLANPRTPTSVSDVTPTGSQPELLALSADGKLLVTAGDDRVLELWDISNPASPKWLALKLNPGIINDIAVSPDGHTLAVAGVDGTVALWDVTDPADAVQRGQAVGHLGQVNAVAFLPGGRRMVTGGADMTVRLWDVSDIRQPRRVGDPAKGSAPIVDVAPLGSATAGSDTVVSSDAAGQLTGWTVAAGTSTPTVSFTLEAGGAGLDLAVGGAGKTLLAAPTGGSAGSPTLISTDPARLATVACQNPANRIGAAEWKSLVSDLAYDDPCAGRQ